jgi:hypothetical protein
MGESGHRSSAERKLASTKSAPARCPPNSGDWKTDIGDGAPKTATTDLIPEVSNLRARKGPRNAGLCAAQGEVSEFHECLAGAGGFEPPDGGIKIRCLTTWLRPNTPHD